AHRSEDARAPQLALIGAAQVQADFTAEALETAAAIPRAEERQRVGILAELAMAQQWAPFRELLARSEAPDVAVYAVCGYLMELYAEQGFSVAQSIYALTQE